MVVDEGLFFRIEKKIGFEHQFIAVLIKTGFANNGGIDDGIPFSTFDDDIPSCYVCNEIDE